jgi:trehalose-6-phosphatase
LHYRQVAPDRHQIVRAQVERLVQQWSESLRLMNGPMAVEVSPKLGWDKGTAVRSMVRRVRLPVLPLFAGDADNDREALEVTHALGGIGFGVGTDAPALAKYRLPDCGALTALLGNLVHALSECCPIEDEAIPRAHFDPAR